MQRIEGLRQLRIPEDFDYDGVPSLSAEIREKFKSVKPATLDQATRISGVTPSALAILHVFVQRHHRAQSKSA